MGGDGGGHRTTTFIVIGLAAVASAVTIYYLTSSSRDDRKKGGTAKAKRRGDDGSGSTTTKSSRSSVLSSERDAGSVDSGSTPTKSNVNSSSGGGSSSYFTASQTAATTRSKSTTGEDEDYRALHIKIEDIDREGKALFKDKKFLEAAEKFTEALDLIEAKKLANATSLEFASPLTPISSNGSSTNNSSSSTTSKASLNRQIITLMNNRSAMYEKAALPDLALSDCDTVLDLDPGHAKARTRRLRILESQNRHSEALVEVCALQLKFMNDNRDKLRLGLAPTGSPPVSQTKIEELVTLIQPGEMERVQKTMALRDVVERPLPSTYTITQLLSSFSGYNKWMGEAAKGGVVSKFTSQLDELDKDVVPRKSLVAFADHVATKATLLLHRGRRLAFEKNFIKAVADFENAFALIEDVSGKDESDHEEAKAEIIKAMEKDNYARLLEWSGMCNHLRHELKGALVCYERCSALEPDNTELLVKRAGVKMDEWDHAGAEKLFTDALALNPTASDALLHRSNMRMLQQKITDSKTDLETCIRLYPNNMMARLRLATVFMALEDMDGAKRVLDQAEEYDPESSEVHCYRGELFFAKGDFISAKNEFEKGMKCDPTNPTPYVNAALAVVNIQPSSHMAPPDFPGAIKLLEKAIEIDPMMHGAYVQLGQMKLSMATDLTKAKEVVDLYDKALEYCRSPEEIKDICSMRILTVAQIDAAHTLRMETLQMQ
jgi:import receptor subunit TOM70